MSDIKNPFEEKEIMAQRSQGWHDIRNGRFTSSELGVLIGSNEDKLTAGALTYVRKKAMERLSGMQDFASAKSLEHGTIHEAHGIRLFEQATGLTTTVAEFVSFEPNTGGSPDSYCGEDAIIEIKCPVSGAVHVSYKLIETAADLKAENKEIYWQIMGNMFFTKRKWCYFISYYVKDDQEGNILYEDLHFIKLPYEDGAGERIIKACEVANKELQSIVDRFTE